AETEPAKRVLSWLYDCEGQAVNADQIKVNEKFFLRYFPGGFFPKTPVMITNRWSPISAMLAQSFLPTVLNREPKGRSVATGIWTPPQVQIGMDLEDAATDEDLFWGIMKMVAEIAIQENALISIVAEPGWH